MATDRPLLRAVLDTNVFVAAYLSRNPNSPTREIIDRWLRGEFELLYSIDLQAEVVEKFTAKGIGREPTELLLAALTVKGVRVDVSPAEVTAVIAPDPDDDLVLACAVTGGATHLVTYDPHFDILGGDHQGIRILSGLGFLAVLRASGQGS